MDGLEELNSRYASILLPVTVIFGMFTFVGVTGNIVVLAVFIPRRSYKRNNFRIFVICQGIVDLLTSAILIPTEMVKQRSYFSFSSLAMCKIKWFFSSWAACAVAICLCVVCIDRYIKVCHPLKKQITPVLATKLCVLLSVCVSLILAVPKAVFASTNELNVTTANETTFSVIFCSVDPRYRSYNKGYRFVLLALLSVMAITSIAFYVCIWYQVWKHRISYHVRCNMRRDLSGPTCDVDTDVTPDATENAQKVQTRRRALQERCLSPELRHFPYKVLIWFILLLVFIVTYLVNVVYPYETPLQTTNLQSVAFYEGFSQIYFVNNIINPIIYALFDKRFRDICKHKFSCLKH